MSETERVINNLNVAKLVLCKPNMVTSEMCIKIGQAISDALAMLKDQQQMIDELKEKLRLLEYGDQNTLQSVLIPAT